MTDDVSVLPMGYIRHEPSIEAGKKAFAASASISGISGAAKASGLSYFNLMEFVASYLKSDGQRIAGGRKLIDLGGDGAVFEPLAQQTGICGGCSFGESVMESWMANWVLTGTGKKPQRCSFAWAYLAGRDSRYVSNGDTGAIPSLSAQAYHDFGALPMNTTSMFDLAPHGPNSEESLCIKYRDNPKPWLDSIKSHAADWKCTVSHPSDAWGVADCIQTTRPVTFGSSYQCYEAPVGGNGISSLYMLRDPWGRPAGHETFADGWLKLNGRLGFIKKESWWNALFPASKWPNNRVTIQTDDGPQVLYPGQCALWADEWMSHEVESWALGYPGSRA